MKIRQITIADNDKLADILVSLAEHVDFEAIKKLREPDPERDDVSQTDDSTMIDYFKELIAGALRVQRVELRTWFSDLLNVSVDEYMTLPFDTDVDVIQQLVDQKGFVSFFVKACAVFRINGVLSKVSNRIKTAFATISS